MLRAAWTRVRNWFGRGPGGESGADDDDNDGSGFARSSLDASVNYAHGESSGNAVRELQRADDHASDLEAAHREDR